LYQKASENPVAAKLKLELSAMLKYWLLAATKFATFAGMLAGAPAPFATNVTALLLVRSFAP
jgi:hypothetical protein